MSQSIRDRQIRREIDEEFRPLFQNYENEKGTSNFDGIPLQELSSKLQESSTLPHNRINSLLRRADADGNNRITYEEFVVKMTQVDDETRRKLGIGKRFLNRAVMAAVPSLRRKTLSYHDAYDCKPPPLFIPLITAAEIVVFLYYALEPTSRARYPVTANSGCPKNSPLLYDPTKRWEAWRFVSYMLLHDGYMHLIFNCLIQLVLGVLLETAHKMKRVGPIYLLGVLAGSLASSCFDRFELLAGASGGCYALIGAHLANVLMNWEEMQNNWKDGPVNFLSSGVFRLFVIVLLTCGDTGTAVYKRLSVKQEVRISFAAHGGGFVAGVLLGVVILYNVNWKHWEKVMMWVFLALYVLLMLAGIVFNLFCGIEGVDLCYAEPKPKPNPLFHLAVKTTPRS